MGKSRKVHVVVAAVVGAAAMLVGSSCTAVSVEPEPETVVVGADLELSGDGAALGTIYRNALELRVEQINQQGLLGDRRLELDVRDNRTDSATAAANVADLAADESVAAIITGGCGPCALAAVEIVNDAGVPTISLAAPGAITEPVADRRYIFRLGPNAADSANALAAELSRAETQTVALVTADNDYGEDGRFEMADPDHGTAARSEFDIVIEERLGGTEEAMRTLAEQIATYQADQPVDSLAQPGDDADAAGPDAVVVWAFAPQAGEFAVHLRDAGYEGALFLDMAAADSLFLTGATGAALAGATMIFSETLVIDEIVATSPAKTSRKTWFNDYSARYGTYHAFASFAADAVLLVTEAINRSDSTDRETLRNAVERTQLDGLTGPLRITPDNHSGLTSLALTALVARGDRWRPAG